MKHVLYLICGFLFLVAGCGISYTIIWPLNAIHWPWWTPVALGVSPMLLAILVLSYILGRSILE